MPRRPERLYQLRFDGNFKPTVPEDVTPPGFPGWGFAHFTSKQEGVQSRTEATLYAIQNGLITVDGVPFESSEDKKRPEAFLSILRTWIIRFFRLG